MKRLDKFYDVVIVGAGKDGVAAYKALSKATDCTILMVSRTFKKVARSLPEETRYEGSIVLLTYVKGLFKLYLADGQAICGRKVVLALGTKSDINPLFANINNVYYKAEDIKLKSKDLPIIITGNNQRAADSALMLADKKYRHIYICSPDAKLYCNEETLNKINHIESILILPLCQITSVKLNEGGDIEEVTLDTFEDIKCKALLLSTKRIPDTDFLADLPVQGFLKGGFIDTHQFKTAVSGLYAVGSCSVGSVKINIKDFLNYI